MKLLQNKILKLLVCLTLMNSYAGCASTHKNETAGQYIDDSVITTKVKSAIFEEKSLKTLQINVKTYKGTMPLCSPSPV